MDVGVFVFWTCRYWPEWSKIINATYIPCLENVDKTKKSKKYIEKNVSYSTNRKFQDNIDAWIHPAYIGLCNRLWRWYTRSCMHFCMLPGVIKKYRIHTQWFSILVNCIGLFQKNSMEFLPFPPIPYGNSTTFCPPWNSMFTMCPPYGIFTFSSHVLWKFHYPQSAKTPWNFRILRFNTLEIWDTKYVYFDISKYCLKTKNNMLFWMKCMEKIWFWENSFRAGRLHWERAYGNWIGRIGILKEEIEKTIKIKQRKV